MKISKEVYEQNIPSCCSYKTWEEHAESMMFCWGLVDAINKNQLMDCSDCLFNQNEKKENDRYN